MSTRSQIDFVDSYKDEKGKKHETVRRIYRHWDGYPDGVIPDLEEFVKFMAGPDGKVTRMGDAEYTAANFIFWAKLHSWLADEKEKKEHPDKPLLRDSWKLGFGVCENDEFHADIEFYYRIDLETGFVSVYEVNREGWDQPVTMKNMVEMKKKKTRIFTRLMGGVVPA